MNGEMPSVRRADAAARAAAALNWLAIGGLVGAVATGVIAVRPTAELEPASRHVAMAFVASVSTGAAVAEDRSAVGAMVERASAGAGVRGEAPATEAVRYVAAPKEKKNVQPVAESKPPQKPSDAAASPPVPASAPASPDAAPVWSEDVIRSAREECAVLMGNLAAEWSAAAPMRTTSCGAPGPIVLRSVGTQKVTLAPAAVTNCSTAAALSRWMDQHVQPAAMKHFGARVAHVAIAASYECRNRYGQAQSPLSEHALANALDLSGFKLTDGRTVNVLGGWGPTARSTQVAAAAPTAAKTVDPKAPAKPPQGAGRMGLGTQSGAVAKSEAASVAQNGPRGAEADFLRSVHASACTVFGTVLGPEANEAHRDHFHLDMKYRRHKSFCE